MKYRFHPEGKATLLLFLTIALPLSLASHYYLPPSWSLFIAFLLILFLVLILQFFRNPERIQVSDTDAIIAPADGKIVVIEKVFEPEYLKTDAIQVSIFMSPFNVHINRNPCDGMVSYYKYHPGKYLFAWHPKSSTENERTTVVIQNKGFGPVLMRQIAGALARRIVCRLNKGDVCLQNAEFGFIKFGSRVDLFLPIDSTILVNKDDIVKGGMTRIASLRK
jgi:phosphatidylserine decarboxylase